MTALEAANNADKSKWSKAQWDEYYGYNVDVVVVTDSHPAGEEYDLKEMEMPLKGECNNENDYYVQMAAINRDNENDIKQTDGDVVGVAVVTAESRRRNSIGCGAYKYNGALRVGAREHRYSCGVDGRRGNDHQEPCQPFSVEPRMWRRRRSSNASSASSKKSKQESLWSDQLNTRRWSSVNGARSEPRRRRSMGDDEYKFDGSLLSSTRFPTTVQRRHSEHDATVQRDCMRQRRRTSIGKGAYKYEGPLPGSGARRRSSESGSYDSINGATVWR